VSLALYSYRHVAMNLPSTVYRSLCCGRISSTLLFSTTHHLIAPIRKLATTSPLFSGETLVQTDRQTSLAWRQIHDESPASYGINTWGGYFEMIPPKALLPYKKTATLENALDYISHGMFTVYYRHSILEGPIELAKVELNGLRVAKEGVTKVKTTMRIGKDLMGSLKAQDSYTKSVASVVFDGGAAFRALKSHGLVKRND